MKATTICLFFVCLFLFNSCSEKAGQDSFLSQLRQDSLLMKNAQKMQRIKAKDITIEKDFLYDQYTLQDTYPYRKGSHRQICQPDREFKRPKDYQSQRYDEYCIGIVG